MSREERDKQGPSKVLTLSLTALAVLALYLLTYVGVRRFGVLGKGTSFAVNLYEDEPLALGDIDVHIRPGLMSPWGSFWSRACYVVFYPPARMEEFLEEDIAVWQPASKQMRLRRANEGLRIARERSQPQSER